MAIPKIEGRWKGYYKYGEGYPKTDKNKKHFFIIEIINKNGLITGTCVDDLSKQFFDTPATIEGMAEEYSIFFILRYPNLLTYDEANQLIVDPEKPSSDIQYTGSFKKRFFSNRYYLEGNWEISGSGLDENGEPWYSYSDGYWQMEPA